MIGPYPSEIVVGTVCRTVGPVNLQETPFSVAGTEIQKTPEISTSCLCSFFFRNLTSGFYELSFPMWQIGSTS